MKRARRIWGVTGALLLGLLVASRYAPEEFLPQGFAQKSEAYSEATQEENGAEQEGAYAGDGTVENSTAEDGTARDGTARDGTARDGGEDVAGDGNTEEAASIQNDRGYAYRTLDEATRQVYDEVYQTLMAHEEKASVSTLDNQVLDKAYKAVFADHGGIFWTTGYVYTQYTKGDTLIELEFAPQYTMTAEEREQVQTQIDAVVNEILGGISMTASDYEKARYVFEYLVSNVDYVTGAADNQNIISVFLNRQTVCQGYASATQYLLDKLGIECAIITGEAEGAAHAWNLVKLDDAYYYMDTTWGSSTYTNEQLGTAKYINYNYFAVTTEALTKTHEPSDYFPLPECTAMADNYYVREGRYVTEWNPDTVGDWCRAAYQTGDTVLSMQFADAELYAQYRSYFIEEQKIADYCEGITNLYYIEDMDQNILTFSF